MSSPIEHIETIDGLDYIVDWLTTAILRIHSPIKAHEAASDRFRLVDSHVFISIQNAIEICIECFDIDRESWS